MKLYRKDIMLFATDSHRSVHQDFPITAMLAAAGTALARILLAAAFFLSAGLPSTASAQNATQNVVWTNLVNTTVTGTTIQKSGGQPWAEDAGAASQQSIASGDAAFQYTVDEVNNFRFVGFGHASTWQRAANIDFSFRMQAGHADVYQNGIYQADILVAVNDVLKIDIVNGVARYYKNGVLQYTSIKTPIYPLFVITSMIDGSSSIAQAMISAAPPPPPPTGAFPCGANPCVRGQFPPASWRPYANTSPFNRIVSSTARLMPNSAAIINRMLGDISANKQVSNMITPNNGTGGWPTYYGISSDPVYTIACGVGNGGYPNVCSVGVTDAPVHAPTGASMQGGDNAPLDDFHDRHITIIDQTNNKEFDLWHVSTSPLPATGGTIKTEWSGYSMSNGDGLSISGEANAGRFGNLAGRVRIEELKDAIAKQTFINHAITIVVDCTTTTTVYPAGTNPGRTCDKINKSDIDAPPMGARIHLNMTVAQINAMAIPEWKKVFLRTFVVYGAIINDTGSSFYFDVQTEPGNQYTSMGVTDPWLAFGKSMAGQVGSDWNVDSYTPGGGYVGLWQNLNDGIDWTAQVWSHLEVLDTCVSYGTC